MLYLQHNQIKLINYLKLSIMSTSTLEETQNRIIFDKAKSFQKFLMSLETMPKGYNRPTKDNHVQGMTLSVLKLGVTRMINVVRTSAFGTENGLYILDGQHLVKAILSLTPNNLRGDFIVSIKDIEDIEDIIATVSLINSTASNWKLEDYLTSWVAEGKKDYILLEDTLRRTKQNINSLIEAFTLQQGNGNKEFKEGRFKANKKQLDNVLRLYDCAVNAGLTHNQSGFKAIVRLKIKYPTLTETEITNAIRKNPTFGFRNSRDGYITLFEDLIEIRK